MDRLALTGLALAASGAIGLVAVELIGSAQASRPQNGTYVMAISSGSALHLGYRGALPAYRGVPLNTVDTQARRLDCARIVEVPSVSLGFRCRAEH